MMRQLKKHTNQTKPTKMKRIERAVNQSQFVQYRQQADNLRAEFGQPTTYSVRGIMVGGWAVTEMVGLAKCEAGEMVGFAPLDAGQSTTPESGRIGTKGLPKGWAPASLVVMSSPFGVMFAPRTVGLNGLPNWGGTIPLVDRWSTNSPMWEAPPAGAFLSEPSPGSPGMKGLTPRAGAILKHLGEIHGGVGWLGEIHGGLGWKIGEVVVGGIQYGMTRELENQLSDNLREVFAIVRNGGFTREMVDILNWAWVDLPRAAATRLGIPPQYEEAEVIPPPPVAAAPRQVAMPTAAKAFADPRPRGIAFASVKTFADVVLPPPPAPLEAAEVAMPCAKMKEEISAFFDGMRDDGVFFDGMGDDVGHFELMVLPPPPAPPLKAAEAVMPQVMEVLYSIRLRGEALSPAYTAKTREETNAFFEGMGDDVSHFELMVSTSPGRWVHPAMAGF